MKSKGLGLHELVDFHRRKVEVLAAHPGCDFLAFETIPESVEALAFVHLMEELGPSAPPFWLSFQCQGRHLASGETLESALKKIAHALAKTSASRLFGLGINCTQPEHAVEQIKTLIQARDSHSEFSDAAMLCYPNSGESWDGSNKTWLPSVSESQGLIESARAWQRAGADVVGGCCRVESHHIKELKCALF